MFKYEIIDEIGAFDDFQSDVYTMEVNIISYNDRKPKIDVRKWNNNKDKMLGGITLTNHEAENLIELLKVAIEKNS